MNARKRVHVQKVKDPTVRHSRMNQARSEEEEKRDRKDRGQEADGKKGSPTNQKKKSEELEQGLSAQLRLTMMGEELPPPMNRMVGIQKVFLRFLIQKIKIIAT